MAGDIEAPKERINVKYVPAADTNNEEKELPLKLLVLGDFVGRDQGDIAIEDRPRLVVDKFENTIDTVLENQNVSLDLAVRDVDSDEEGAQIGVRLSFDKMSSFTPDAVADQIESTRKKKQLRDALVELKSPVTNNKAFREKINELLNDEAMVNRLMTELGIE